MANDVRSREVPVISFDRFAESVGAPPVFDTDGLAEFLKVPVYAIYKMNSRGMPNFRVGKQLRYRRDRVLAWLEDQH